MAEGVCPFKGCDLTQRVCSHLNRYLSYRPETFTSKKTSKVVRGKDHMDVDVVYTAEIDAFSAPVQAAPDSEEPTVRDLIAKLKRLGFQGYQIQLLIDRHVDKLTFKQILELRGWTSYGALWWHYKRAMEQVRKLGIRKFKDA